jgi:glycosyltransferase involved in cell wall biosynthesis
VTSAAEPLDILFLNEGELGAGILGHPRVEAAIKAGIAGRDDVNAEFVSLPPMSRAAEEVAARAVPGLGALDLDLQSLRWHAVQAVRTRKLLRRTLAARTPDVLHAHTHSIMLGSRPVMTRLPTFLSVDATIWGWHELGVWRRARAWSRTLLKPLLTAERAIFEAAACVFAFTDWSRRDVLVAAPGATVVAHHPGVDLGFYRPGTRTPREKVRVLFVGGRFPEKGGLDLLAALEPFFGDDVELDIVTTARLAPRHGVSVHRLPGGDPRLAELHRQADVFCLPTYADANPWAILEAMASATPVVSTSVGGIPELLDDGRAGRLVPPGDVRALRATLRELIDDPAERERLAHVGLRRCRERYDSAVQVPALIELIRAHS